jgi:hypothetical protein
MKQKLAALKLLFTPGQLLYSRRSVARAILFQTDSKQRGCLPHQRPAERDYLIRRTSPLALSCRFRSGARTRDRPVAAARIETLNARQCLCGQIQAKRKIVAKKKLWAQQNESPLKCVKQVGEWNRTLKSARKQCGFVRFEIKSLRRHFSWCATERSPQRMQTHACVDKDSNLLLDKHITISVTKQSHYYLITSKTNRARVGRHGI